MADAPPKLRIGTRGSDLALYQANYVKDAIAGLGRECELIILKTQGDKDQSRPITELGGVGVFVKELERALLGEEVDLAVHSLKDLPTDMPEGLTVASYPIRVAPHELLIVHPDAVDETKGLIPLKDGATVGTASERRRALLLEWRPDLKVVGIRGNVPTRVDKARGDEVDAVVLAAAGVDRLELKLEGLRRFDLPLDDFLPAPGQAALAIQTRSGDTELLQLLKRLDDLSARETTEAERHLLHAVGAGCSVPLGAHATRADATLDARGEVVPPIITLQAVYQVVEKPLRLRRAHVRGVSPQAAADLALRVLQPPKDTPTVDLSGKRILLARDPLRAEDLVTAIEAAGGEVSCRAPTARASLTTKSEVEDALRWLPREGWILFASVNAVGEMATALSPAREALRLIRQVQRGALELDQLEMAAFLGFPPAELAVGEETVARLRTDRDLANEVRKELRYAGIVHALHGGPPSDIGKIPDLDDELDLDARVSVLQLAGAILEVRLKDAVAGRRIGAVGPGTARALAEWGVPVDVLAREPTGAGLAKSFLAWVDDARPRVLLPAAAGGREELHEAVAAAGCAVKVLELYESRPLTPPPREVLRVDGLVLASPSGAKATLGSGLPPASCRIVAIGPTTAAAVEELGGTVAGVAKEPTTAGLMAALAWAFGEATSVDTDLQPIEMPGENETEEETEEGSDEDSTATSA